MKSTTPHDPLDDLIAAALHGDLTPQERTQFEARLATDPAAQSAYQEAQAMNDLLEKTHKSAQPDAAFEQRMVSGVRRKLPHEPHRETAWESVFVLWGAVKRIFKLRPTAATWGYLGIAFIIIAMIGGTALGPITSGIKNAQQSAAYQEARSKAVADYQAQVDAGVSNPVMKDAKEFLATDAAPQGEQVKSVFSTITRPLAAANDGRKPMGSVIDASQPLIQQSTTQARIGNLEKAKASLQAQLKTDPYNKDAARRLAHVEQQQLRLSANNSLSVAQDRLEAVNQKWNEPTVTTTPQGGTVRGSGFAAADGPAEVATTPPLAPAAPTVIANADAALIEKAPAKPSNNFNVNGVKIALDDKRDGVVKGEPTKTETPAAIDDRKLIRNAQLDLEVKSYQTATDLITALTKSAGGYVDTSNSQRGGNGKLQGTVVVKILPQNLDAFLLKLRELGEVKNQSVSTDDVTKAYFDTQARLANSQKMEVQLQDLLKRENGKVSDLLAVERELGRVRGEIEQMQGQLKLYDFQVQYATVTIQMAEKDLKQAAAYLLKEQDNFSLFATDVEATFQTARKTAEAFKAQVLVANLNHNSGSDVSAVLQVSVPPDQIEPFLAEIRAMGRVANFNRDTKRIAQDGGDSAQPADETLTEKDKVMVNVAIRSDDETRKQVAMTVVTKTVDDALDKAKTATMAQTGAAILSSSLNKTPQGQSTAQLSVRIPGKSYAALMDAFRALGRAASLSVQRNDDAGPGANGDDAPVIVSLSLTDDDAPLQSTDMSVVGSDVDSQSQQIKKDAAAAGVEIKSSSFQQQPDGTQMAQMTFRMPMSKYNAFLATVQKLGKVESLSVQRNDRPDQANTDDSAPAEINLQLHKQRGIVAENNGLGATLRQTFGEGAGALFGSIRVIGVLIAFTLPWVITLAIIAWVARRIYVWRKRK